MSTCDVLDGVADHGEGHQRLRDRGALPPKRWFASFCTYDGSIGMEWGEQELRRELRRAATSGERLELDLSGKQLTALPSSIGESFMFGILNLSNNQLTSLPPEIEQLTGLVDLDVSRNQLDALPRGIGKLNNLLRLDLSNNQLVTLPSELGDLPETLVLHLEGNPLREPLPELLARGIPDLFAYLRSLAASKQQYEARVLLVGEGNVGKSSLVAALRDEPFVENRDTTHGIQIGALSLPHPELDVDITLNTWDFGGQEVYRITHQFFFSRRALYVLVWRPREGQEENAIESWCKRIMLRVGDDARIMVVATHCDERNPELESVIQNAFSVN